MTTLYNYRLYCIQEASFVNVWGTEAPTTCPNDHSDKSIDATQTVIIGKMDDKTVVTTQPTIGSFQHTTRTMTIPAGNVGDVTVMDLSWPMSLQVWKTEFYTKTENIGDYLSVVLAPDTLVGVITVNAAIGATTIHVSPTAVTNELIVRGIHLKLDNGTTSNECGRILAFDKDANTITFETPLTNNFTGMATMIKLTLVSFDTVLLHRPDSVHRVGEKGFQGKALPPNTLARALYTNNTTDAKTLVFTLEYYYT